MINEVIAECPKCGEEFRAGYKYNWCSKCSELLPPSINEILAENRDRKVKLPAVNLTPSSSPKTPKFDKIAALRVTSNYIKFRAAARTLEIINYLCLVLIIPFSFYLFGKGAGVVVVFVCVLEAIVVYVTFQVFQILADMADKLLDQE